MTVLRIVANLAAPEPHRGRVFYEDVLGLVPVMDQGWIVTLASDVAATPQVSLAHEGGSGTQVPHLTIEVDDVDAAYQRAIGAGFEVIYGVVDEPWGVRRFYVNDPFGNVVNIMTHTR